MEILIFVVGGILGCWIGAVLMGALCAGSREDAELALYNPIAERTRAEFVDACMTYFLDPHTTSVNRLLDVALAQHRTGWVAPTHL